MKLSGFPVASIFLTFSVLLLITGCTREKDRVREQIDAINYEHQLVVNRLDALERALESYVPDIMDRTYLQALEQLDSSEIVIRSLPGVNSENDMRDEALLLLDRYRLLLNNEYPEIIRIQKKPAGKFTAADEFLVINLGKHIDNYRRRAKETYEKEAASVLEKYGISFSPVTEEIPDPEDIE